MKNSIKTLVVIAVLAIAGNVFAQAATADGVIKTCTICPISIVHDQEAALNFGTLINTNTAVAQTMTVNPDGTFAGSAGLIVYHGSNTHDEPSADHFTLGGESGYHFDLRVPNWQTPEPINIPGGGTVTLFTSNLPNESDRQFPGLESTMECVNMQLYVGGTFNIPVGGVPPGDATTPYRVQVQYN